MSRYLILLALLVGCTPSVEKTETHDAVALVNSLVFVKAKNGLCYGVTSTSRISSNMTVAINQMIVSVDCAKVEPELVR